MSAPGKLVRSSRWKSGPGKGQRPLGSECCVATGDRGCEAYTAIAWGVGLSHERSDIAGAESLYSLEGNMCGTVMRGADVLPGSKATSRAKGSYRNLGGLASGRQSWVRGTVRIGKARNNAERSTAELVEPTAGTKDNAGQPSTCWTQSRIPTSSLSSFMRYAS